MKKSLIILTLATLQCACTTQVGTQTRTTSMLSFDAISAEISIDYQTAATVDDLSETIAANTE